MLMCIQSGEPQSRVVVDWLVSQVCVRALQQSCLTTLTHLFPHS